MTLNYEVLDRIFRCTKFDLKNKLLLEAVSDQFLECSPILWRDVTHIDIRITDLSMGEDRRNLEITINGINTTIADGPRAVGAILDRIRDHKLQGLRIDYYSTEPAHEADIRRIEPIFQEFLRPEYGQKLTRLRSISCEGFFYNQPEISKLIQRNSSTVRRIVINPGHNDLHKALEECGNLRSLSIFQTTWLTYLEQRLGPILAGKPLKELVIASSKNSPIPRFVENYVLKSLATLEKPIKHLKIYCQLGNSLCPIPSFFHQNDRQELRVLSGIRTLELCRGFNSNIFRFCPQIRTIVVNHHDVLDPAKGAVWLSIRIESFFTSILQDHSKKLDRIYELELIMRIQPHDSYKVDMLIDKMKKHFGTDNYTAELSREHAVTFFQGNAAVLLAIETYTNYNTVNTCFSKSPIGQENNNRASETTCCSPLISSGPSSCDFCPELCCSHLRCIEKYHC